MTANAKAGPLELLLTHKSFPQCDEARVLSKIISRFNWAERRQWKRGFGLEEVRQPRERTGEEWPGSDIPRRFCRGHAILSNGTHPTVHYLIEGGQGFAGNGFKVEFCVDGLDPWRVYDGRCRVVRR